MVLNIIAVVKIWTTRHVLLIHELTHSQFPMRMFASCARIRQKVPLLACVRFMFCTTRTLGFTGPVFAISVSFFYNECPEIARVVWYFEQWPQNFWRNLDTVASNMSEGSRDTDFYTVVSFYTIQKSEWPVCPHCRNRIQVAVVGWVGVVWCSVEEEFIITGARNSQSANITAGILNVLNNKMTEFLGGMESSLRLLVQHRF